MRQVALLLLLLLVVAGLVGLGHEDPLRSFADPALGVAGPNASSRLILLRVLNIERQLNFFKFTTVLDHGERGDPGLDGDLHADMALMDLDLCVTSLGLDSLIVLTCRLRLALVDLAVVLLK